MACYCSCWYSGGFIRSPVSEKMSDNLFYMTWSQVPSEAVFGIIFLFHGSSDSNILFLVLVATVRIYWASFSILSLSLVFLNKGAELVSCRSSEHQLSNWFKFIYIKKRIITYFKILNYLPDWDSLIDILCQITYLYDWVIAEITF